MVILRARQKAEGQSTADARAHVLQPGEFGVLEDEGERYVVVGDGTSTVGELVDAEEYLIWKKDVVL